MPTTSALPAGRKITVAVVDDHELVLSGIVRTIDALGTHQVVTSALSGRELLAQLRTLGPTDMAVVDVRMPEMDGVAVIDQLHRLYPKMKLVAISVGAEPEVVHRAIDAGACAYIHKNTRIRHMGVVLQDIATKGYHLSKEHGEAITGQTGLCTETPVVDGVRLPPKVWEMLGHLLEDGDIPDQVIADRMGVGTSRVQNMMQWIHDQFNLHTRSGVIVWAMKHGLHLLRGGVLDH